LILPIRIIKARITGQVAPERVEIAGMVTSTLSELDRDAVMALATSSEALAALQTAAELAYAGPEPERRPAPTLPLRPDGPRRRNGRAPYRPAKAPGRLCAGFAWGGADIPLGCSTVGMCDRGSREDGPGARWPAAGSPAGRHRAAGGCGPAVRRRGVGCGP
jgi:hypothetical protein